jgi:hypothetical protein
MSQILTVELDEKVYAALVESASARGFTPAQLAAAVLAQRFPTVPPTEEKKGDIRKFFGIVHAPHAVGLDNESIDRDLAREYGRGLDGDD